ncbi:hypothetical protein GCM10020229_60470 [Kitasatospora albolonga]
MTRGQPPGPAVRVTRPGVSRPSGPAGGQGRVPTTTGQDPSTIPGPPTGSSAPPRLPAATALICAAGPAAATDSGYGEW